MEFPGVALVTGAASGIGRATAQLYAEEGCQRIVVADIDYPSLQDLKQELESNYKGVSVLTTLLDVRNERSVQDMIDATLATFGRIDYCANVAGIILVGDSVNLSTADFDMVYQVNLRGVFLCSKAEITAMLKQEPLSTKDSAFPARGAIVNVASQAGLMGNGNLPAYVSSKHGCVGLSKSDGLKYGPEGIRVNALCPGSIQTPMLGHLPQGQVGIERQAERKREIALGRVGQPREIAQCAIFLTSGRSSFITATTLAAHGGLQC